MPVVPMRPDNAQSSATMPPQAPPRPTFLLMAAAQMHSEGRLLKSQMPQPTIPPTEAQPANGK